MVEKYTDIRYVDHISTFRTCKESIVIVKKFDFEILTYFILFEASGIHLCYFLGDVYVCVYVSGHDSV